MKTTRLEAWSLASQMPAVPGDRNPPASSLFRSSEGALCVAEAWRRWGELDLDDRSTASRIDEQEHWWRYEFDNTEFDNTEFDQTTESTTGEFELVLGGVATIAEVYVDGIEVARSDSMFRPMTINVSTRPQLLEIVVRSMTQFLDSRQWARPRWKTRLVSDQRLRHVRTSPLGRISWSPPTPLAGPYGGVELRLIQPGDVTDVRVSASLLKTDSSRSDETTGRVEVSVFVNQSGVGGTAGTSRIGMAMITSEVEVGSEPGSRPNSLPEIHWLTPDEAHPDRWFGHIDINEPERWFPWTHGEPALHKVGIFRQHSDGTTKLLAQHEVGFRTVAFDLDNPGFVINGIPVFTRGAVAFPFDVVNGYDHERMVQVLTAAKAGGLNMIRLGGTNWYEDEAFHGTCDRLGLMVWQDLPFASFDYPTNSEFEATVVAELEHHVPRFASHPSTVMIAGSSEVEQQAAMMGRNPDVLEATPGRTWIANACARLAPTLPYVSSSPTGGHLPMRVDTGISHYFGVGAYRRPVDDCELSNVRFAAECLAFSQLDQAGNSSENSGKRIPRDPGADSDFGDVNLFYSTAFSSSADSNRADDPTGTERALTAAAIGETMATVFSKWRSGSRCSGGLVLALNDPWPSDGWGLVSHAATSKRSFLRLAHALQPTALLALDKGLNGLDLVAINDSPLICSGFLRVQAISGKSVALDVTTQLEVSPHSKAVIAAESIWQRFADPTYAYRFGVRPCDYVVATWQPQDGVQQVDEPDLANAFGSVVFAVPGASPFPVGSLAAAVQHVSEGSLVVQVQAQSVARFIEVVAAGYSSSISMFDLGPGQVRTVELSRQKPHEESGRGGSRDVPEMQISESQIFEAQIWCSGQLVTAVRLPVGSRS